METAEPVVDALAAAVPELRDALAGHLRDNGELPAHVFLGCDVVPFVLAAWGGRVTTFPVASRGRRGTKTTSRGTRNRVR